MFDPGDWLNPPHELPHYRFPEDTYDDMTFTKSLSVMPGTLDPQDASSFTINVIVDGRTDVFRGTLYPDEGHLEITSANRHRH